MLMPNTFMRLLYYVLRSRYQGCSCNGFHTYASEEILQRNYAQVAAHGDWAVQAELVRSARFADCMSAKIEPTTGPSGATWEGKTIYEWQLQSQGHAGLVLAESVLLASVDLSSAPSLAGRAVYLALVARLPLDTRVRLTLAIDRGDGEWQYNDGGSASQGHPGSGGGSAPRGEWSTFSYHGMLNANGTAKFALFQWMDHTAPEQASANSTAVQLSGPIAIAAVGTRFTGAAINA